MRRVSDFKLVLRRFRISRLLFLVPFALVLGAGILIRNAVAHERVKFERESADLLEHPHRWVGRSVGVDTLDCWGVSSRYIALRTDKLVSEFSKSHRVPAQTYFSPVGDMPTQETIWQFPEYFVRVYATSALDRDGIDVGVYAGMYKDFRGDRLTEKCDPLMRFVAIDYASPRRFLDAGR